MYNEEEDDLPLPYRQLAGFLRTGSLEFNRRLAAFLSTNVDVRSALDQIIRDSHNVSPAAAASIGEGPSFHDGLGESAAHQTSFPPRSFVPQYESHASFAPGQLNPPSQPARATAPPHPSRGNMPPRQIPGTNFYMTPIGLSTMPPSYFPASYSQNLEFTPTTSAPALHMPQQSMVNPNHYSAVLSPEQFQALSRNFSSDSQAGNDMVGSPMSDASMVSLRTASTPTMVPAEPAPMRRMSVPARNPEPSLRASSYSPHLHQFPQDSSSPARVPRLRTGDLSIPTDGRRSLPQSPGVKRKASSELSSDQPAVKNARTPESVAPPPQPSLRGQEPDFGPFDLGLPQHTQDLLYDPTIDMQNDAMMMFGLPPNTNQSVSYTVRLGDTSKPPTRTGGDSQTHGFFDDTEDEEEESLFTFPNTNFDSAPPMEESDTPATYGVDFTSKINNVESGNEWQEYFRQESSANPQQGRHSPRRQI
ncbi:hypothetical protein ABW20_dc0101512 [Dactylellina cionopaga]|nr:hypothetical protein ABW20_dc0101512 [Dactylellina cionopaga]